MFVNLKKLKKQCFRFGITQNSCLTSLPHPSNHIPFEFIIVKLIIHYWVFWSMSFAPLSPFKFCCSILPFSLFFSRLAPIGALFSWINRTYFACMFDDDLWKSYVYWTTFSNVKYHDLCATINPSNNKYLQNENIF